MNTIFARDLLTKWGDDVRRLFPQMKNIFARDLLTKWGDDVRRLFPQVKNIFARDLLTKWGDDVQWLFPQMKNMFAIELITKWGDDVGGYFLKWRTYALIVCYEKANNLEWLDIFISPSSKRIWSLSILFSISLHIKVNLFINPFHIMETKNIWCLLSTRQYI